MSKGVTEAGPNGGELWVHVSCLGYSLIGSGSNFKAAPTRSLDEKLCCSFFGREIAAYDIQTKRCDVYGQDEGHSERVMLVYDGLHYDALAVAGELALSPCLWLRALICCPSLLAFIQMQGAVVREKILL